jgi:hypothetical protein
VPSQLAPTLCDDVSQAVPHVAQLVVVLREVSQPSRSGAVVLQSAQPAAQLE